MLRTRTPYPLAKRPDPACSVSLELSLSICYGFCVVTMLSLETVFQYVGDERVGVPRVQAFGARGQVRTLLRICLSTLHHSSECCIEKRDPITEKRII